MDKIALITEVEYLKKKLVLKEARITTLESCLLQIVQSTWNLEKVKTILAAQINVKIPLQI